ncbi:MAG: hypothetical protein ACRCZE_02940 [Candidatus Altimarinota bacterium]
MKLFLLIALIIVSSLILILFFQNLWATLDGVGFLFFQFDQESSAGVALLAYMFVGFLAGALATALAFTLVTEGDQEEPGGSNW